MKATGSSKAPCLSKDGISNLPSAIIENILCGLSIHEAARTSSLSKEWRYKWTKIPNLVIYARYMFGNLKIDEEICEVFCAIYQILLMRRGPIHEFTLSIDVDETCVEIDHIIDHLSRDNAVKKLKLELSINEDADLYRIPSSIFLLHHLVDLSLSGCDFKHQPTFNGFGSLTTLYLRDVNIHDKSLLHLLSNCPLLKTVTLFLHDEQIICDGNCTIIELIECLPMIEHLTTWDLISHCYVLDSVPQEIPASLIHLKYLCMEYADEFRDGLRLIALLIRCSPNLEKITIKICEEGDCDEINSFILEAYPNIQLEHLNELEILCSCNMMPDLEFVMVILAKSPVLKKVKILLKCGATKNDESEILRILLNSQHASPVVEITAKNQMTHDDYTVDVDTDDDQLI